ncbi:MAG: sialate O-acetylesterase, partial [Planctomycetota bacterium]
MNRKMIFFVLCLTAGMIMVASSVSAAGKINTNPKQQLPDPDGKPADMSKPVQVYILLGQSNMLGFGRIDPEDKNGTLSHAVKTKKKYPYLVDDAGNWTERKDVRYVRVMGSGTGKMRQFNNEWMTIKGGR